MRYALISDIHAIVSLDASGCAVEFVRVTYDVERAAGAILERTLPDNFADYLRTRGAALTSRAEA